MNNSSKVPQNIHELYTGDDLDIIFKGGFINFGYWEGVAFGEERITDQDMIQANQSLYEKVFDLLEITSKDTLLEVGSGHGAGCHLANNLYSPIRAFGLDYFQAHVDRAHQTYASQNDSKNLFYLRGMAEEMPFPEKSIDKLYTIEAFQHFEPSKAIPEFARVLKQNGKMVICTFFATNKAHLPTILELLPKPAVLSDRDDEKTGIALPEVLELLKLYKFDNIVAEPIGEHVWKGYDKWVRQRMPCIWDTHWLIGYQKGLLDYYVIQAGLI